MPRRNSFLGRLVGAFRGPSAHYRHRRANQFAPALDGLEGRVVLSHFGGHHFQNLAGGLGATSNVSALTSTSSTTGTTTTGSTTAGAMNFGGGPGFGGDFGGGPGGGAYGGLFSGSGSTTTSQLQTDMQQLQTDTNAIYSNSAVTDAQRQALTTDLYNLGTSGVRANVSSLQTVANTLLTDLANGKYDANASTIQSDFAAAFTTSDGSALTSDQTTAIETAYNHFLAVAQNLNATTDELNAITTDQTNIQNDLGLTGTSTGTTSTNTPAQSTALNLILGGPVGGGFGGGPGGGHHGFGGHGRF